MSQPWEPTHSRACEDGTRGTKVRLARFSGSGAEAATEAATEAEPRLEAPRSGAPPLVEKIRGSAHQ